MALPDADDVASDAERFFETLAGREDAHPGAVAMRCALLAEAETLREVAQESRQHLLAPAAQAKMDDIKRQLIAEGVLSDSVQLPQPRGLEGGITQPVRSSAGPSLAEALVERLRHWVGGSWQRPLALTAAVLMAAVAVLQFQGNGDESLRPDELRGAPAHELQVDDVEATMARLQATLSAAGADVAAAQLNASTWTLEVRVEGVSRTETVVQLLERAGFKNLESSPYRLTVRAKRSR
jgi:hypothetical protein